MMGSQEVLQLHFEKHWSRQRVGTLTALTLYYLLSVFIAYFYIVLPCSLAMQTRILDLSSFISERQINY